jgi:murein DD-endopeptidase MepM/ murein hydrolase activator NlpD
MDRNSRTTFGKTLLAGAMLPVLFLSLLSPAFGQEEMIPMASEETSSSSSSQDSAIPTIEEYTPLYNDSSGSKVKRDGASTEVEKIEKIETQFKQYQQKIIDGWESKEAYQRADLLERQKALDERVDDYQDSATEIEDYEAKLTPLRMQIQTLAGQISFLEQEIVLTQKKISNVVAQINEQRIEIDDLLDEIDVNEVELEDQKQAVLQYMKLLYQHESKFYDYETGKLHDLKILLADEKMGEIFRSERYISLVQQSVRTLIVRYERLRTELEWKKETLYTKQNRLRKLEATLVQENKNLEQQVEGKEILLKTTLGEEARYQVLLKEMHKQQEEAATEIEALRQEVLALSANVSASRSKASGSTLSSEELRNRAYAVYRLGQDGVVGQFSWPVEPYRGISAYFRDPSYTKVFGVPHSAIDVPTPQSTPILAPADGYVYKVKDNGYGYSYIILAHKGDFLTVYGHVSKILVNTGDLITHGEVIGLSGATPGTPGAGWMTTGPHLHFEVYKNGKHVDPLDYMDVTKLKSRYIPPKASVSSPVRVPARATTQPKAPTPATTPTPTGESKVKRVQ